MFGDFSFLPNVGQSSLATKSLLEKKGITSLLLLLLFSLNRPPFSWHPSRKNWDSRRRRFSAEKGHTARSHTRQFREYYGEERYCANTKSFLGPPFLSDPVILLLEEERREMFKATLTATAPPFPVWAFVQTLEGRKGGGRRNHGSKVECCPSNFVLRSLPPENGYRVFASTFLCWAAKLGVARIREGGMPKGMECLLGGIGV